MKHIRRSLMAALLVTASLTGSSLAQPQGPPQPIALGANPFPPAPVAPPPPPASELVEPRIILGAEYLLLAPRRSGQTYAIVGRNPFWGPQGEIKSLDGGYDSGFRLSAGFRAPEAPWEMVLRYTYFHGDNDASYQGTADTAIFPTLTHPITMQRAQAVYASNHVQFHLADLELTRLVPFDNLGNLRVFAGPRFVNVEQGIGATYQAGNGAVAQTCRWSEFNGGGLRAGAESEVWFADCLGLYLRGSATLMTGHFTNSRTELVNSTTIVDVGERTTRLIPMMDLGVGLNFRRNNWRLSIGYEFMNWFDMVDSSDFSDDANPSKLQRASSNLGFDGLVFRAEVSF
ncbi:MAG: Lpg1974 family pore-forming outer membrane protein [Gemmataceae bacterium]